MALTIQIIDEDGGTHEMNLLESEILQVKQRMEKSEISRFLQQLGRTDPGDVELRLGRYHDEGPLVLVASTKDGEKIGTAVVLHLVIALGDYVPTYPTPQWRRMLEGILVSVMDEI